MFFTGKSKWRLSQLVLACSVMLPHAAAQANMVISEVLYDAVGTDNGNVFIELFGTPGTLLDGLLLEGVNGTNGSVYKSVLLTGMIPPDGVFVIGDDSGDGTSLVSNVDLVREVDLQNGPDSLVLRDINGILDALGYGNFASAVFAGEGSAAADVPGGSSLARINVMLDTQNNLADFTVLEQPTPGSVPPAAVPLPPAVLLFMSGVFGLIGIARKRTSLHRLSCDCIID